MSAHSVSVAKDRLNALILADRMQCTPETAEKFSSDIYNTISRYMDISRENFRVKISGADIHIKTGQKGPCA